MGRRGRRRLRRVAFGLLASACLLVPAAPAFADSPHVTPTTDTASCAACHLTHTASTTGLERTGASADSTDTVCIGCHSGALDSATSVLGRDGDSFAAGSGHKLEPTTDNPAKIAGCWTCHDAHGASAATRGIPVGRINGSDISSAGKGLCLACHDAANSWYGAGYPSMATPTHDDTGFPVLGTWPGPAVYASRTNAHRLIPESTQTVGVSEPIRREQGDCLYCHGAHGGPNAYDGLVTTFTVPAENTFAADTTRGSFAALCFTCHGGVTPSGFTSAPVDIKRYTVGGGSRGHAIVTSGGTLPVGSPLPCFECHNPHGSSRGNASMLSDELGGSLETSSAAGVRAFCFTCHTTADTPQGWDSQTAAYSVVASETRLFGLPRGGAELHLSSRDGHSVDSTVSCYECHGDDYGVGGKNVHDPASGETSVSAGLAFQILPSLATSFSIDASGSAAASGSVQASGSIDPSATVEADSTVLVDVTPPITVSNARSTYSGSATIALDAVDEPGGSGVAATYYSLDGDVAATGTVVSVTSAGAHSLSFWSVDRAGNVEPAVTATFTVGSPVSAPQQVSFDLRRGVRVASGT